MPPRISTSHGYKSDKYLSGTSIRQHLSGGNTPNYTGTCRCVHLVSSHASPLTTNAYTLLQMGDTGIGPRIVTHLHASKRPLLKSFQRGETGQGRESGERICTDFSSPRAAQGQPPPRLRHILYRDKKKHPSTRRHTLPPRNISARHHHPRHRTATWQRSPTPATADSSLTLHLPLLRLATGPRRPPPARRRRRLSAARHYFQCSVLKRTWPWCGWYSGLSRWCSRCFIRSLRRAVALCTR